MRKLPLAIGLLLLSFAPLLADEGHPVAIRHWPGGGFTIETMWGLSVGIDLNETAKESLPKAPDFEADTLKSEEHETLDRLPNKEAIQFGQTMPKGSTTGVFVNKGTVGQTMIEVDAVSLFHLNGMKPDDLRSLLKKAKPDFDDLENDPAVPRLYSVNVIATDPAFDEELIKSVVAVLRPEVVVVNAALDSVGGESVKKIDHNTVAVSHDQKRERKTRYVSLGTKPYQMSDEVAELFKKKEASQKASRDFFAAFSIEQMNFKPANGTHTPRWNTEHMMGRELQFFSQIYNAMDPTIPVMNIHPAQMPKDYKFAHPDWTGKEESRQTERVEQFTRRFAYLLDGIDLDKKAPGSRFWTPRALLKQMERHYNEHTGNVKKKMELPGWPKSK